ncbi:MAG: hypothetical protein KAV83_05040 [Desulfobacterales bacterium]|nr:hypothetical protein [Desulfobacterales bacterium]
MDDISKTVGGFRAAIQDLLVPELKAIQRELRHQSEILGRQHIKQEVSQYTSKTNALEKRVDDLWALLKSSRFFPST